MMGFLLYWNRHTTGGQDMWVICQDNEEARDCLRRLLFNRGILTVPMDYRAVLRTGGKLPFDAIVFPAPFEASIPEGLFHLVKRTHPHIPTIAILRAGERTPPNVDIGVHEGFLAGDLVHKIMCQLSHRAGRDYALAIWGPARDHLLEHMPTWLSTPLELTPIERSIYRYLILKQGDTATASELLRYCSKPGTDPTLTNIPTHVWGINKKAMAHLGHHIITFDSTGYSFLTEL